MTREILLNAFDMNCVGHQSCGLWRHPRDRSGEYASMRYWQDLARTLERGLFDGIFLADVTGLYDVYGGTPDAALRGAAQVPANDPFTIVPVMAAVTEHLGFGVTGSIPYEPPAAFARRMSSLDHLTGGRMGWNIVTGYLDSAARGAGRPKQIAHDTRYDIAAEYMEVMYGLWEGSWEDGAVLRDRERGVYADPRRVHEIRHDGEHFRLRAVHICEPSPQRTPVLFQAGASAKGQSFAAAHAECVFIGGARPADQVEWVANLRRQAVHNGRDPRDLRVFAMMCAIVGETDSEAESKLRDYQQYASPEAALALMSGWTGIDLSRFELADSVEEMPVEAVQSAMKALGTRSVGEWAEYLAIGGASPVLVGSARRVADQLEQWVEESDVDGFNLTYTVMPESIDDFVRLVVPELQRRGVYKKCHAEGTLREKLFGRGPRLESPHPAPGYRRGSGQKGRT